MNSKYKNANHSTKLVTKGEVTYVTFPLLQKEGLIHGFSTRLGGVSKGYFSSMNLSFQRGDREEDVRENYKRIGEAIGFSPENLVFSDQIHEDTIYSVTKDDCGKGYTKELLKGNDGLVTNERQVPLVTFYADCVPIFFYDPVKKVIGMAHSGWRGTVKRIGCKMLSKMQTEYGSKVEDILVVIAPSICKDCYEISEDVANEFKKEMKEIPTELYLEEKGNGKYQLDLWKVNEEMILRAGVQREHLAVTDLCTCCNPELFFSHRASEGKRGNLAGFMMLS